MSASQLPIDFAPPQDANGATDSASSWFGLSIDHRALFEGLQDDWLRPPEGLHGHMLGVRAFASDGVQPANGHRVLVHLKFDLERLPQVPVYRRRAGEWVAASIASDEADDSSAFWAGALPTFAISALLVKSNDDCSRLLSLARQVSNVALPVTPRVIRSNEDTSIPLSAPPVGKPHAIVLPQEMDAVRGAMTMAMWAVPRIDPWLDLLCESLTISPSEKLATQAEYLCSPWWAIPPWTLIAQLQPNSSPQERLWLSAVRAFVAARNGPTIAADLVHQIATDASRDAPEMDLCHFREWGQETNGVLRGDKKLGLSDWKARPVGKAIQLVLARPDPSVFVKWKEDLPSVPPTVWWSAATLCGLLHGYRHLPTSFRGEPDQQRLFAIHALSALHALPAANNWAALVQGSPEWRRQSGDISFSWSGAPFARKPENARGRWFNANLDDYGVRKAAVEISKSNAWPCIRTKVAVPAGDVPFSGESIEVIPSPEQHLKLKGLTEFTLPQGAVFEPVLDAKEFRWCIVTEGATLIPPETQRRIESPTSKEIPGLVYVPNFLTEAQESELVALIDKGEWSNVLKRRVQQFGWRYDYKSREIDASMRLGPLPEWATALAKRLKEEGHLPHFADQVIVNEYIRNQGISRHIDCFPCFEDGIAMISLLESWEMIFRDTGGRAQIAQLLANRSVAVMSGDARYKWSHEIPMRLTEPGGLRRQRRLSVTFRKVNSATEVREPRPVGVT